MSRGLKQMAVAVFMAASLIVSPGFAQPQEAQPQNAGIQGQPANQLRAQATPPEPVQPREVISGADYSRGKRWYPNPIAPYTSLQVASPSLTNSPRINQFIQNGKLMMS